MNKKLIGLSAATILFILPAFSLAINIADVNIYAEPTGTLTDIILVLNKILPIVWAVFVAIAIIMFIVAGIDFLIAQGEPGKLQQARRFVIWGFVGVAVAIIGYSVFKLVNTILGL